jgi:hypothetical protein
MNCISPPELDDQQLVAYLDGAADETITDHLKRCPYCREKAQGLSRWQKRLKTRLFRTSCPPALELGEYQMGMLSGARAMAIAKHIVECPHCSREVKQLQTYLRDEVADEPKPAKPIGQELKDGLTGLIGVITGQVLGGLKPAAMGVRGKARQPITIEAGDVHVVLDVQSGTEGRVTLWGQIASEELDDWTRAQVELWQAGEPQRTTSIDEIGTFRFEGVLSGPTELLITSSSGKAISVPNIDATV